MRGVFREDHNMFRDQARRFVDREIVPYLHEWEKTASFPRKSGSRPVRTACYAPRCLKNTVAPEATSVTRR